MFDAHFYIVFAAHDVDFVTDQANTMTIPPHNHLSLLNNYPRLYTKHQTTPHHIIVSLQKRRTSLITTNNQHISTIDLEDF